jgi:ketosteroid isomerase-like protein
MATGTALQGEANRATVERLLAGIDAGDISVMDEVFADDAVMEWPASRERIVGAENRRAVYSRTPVLPKVSMRRLLGAGDLWIAEATMTYDGHPYEAALIFEFTEGRITKQTGYWAEPSAPPAWRAAWVENLP